MSDLEDAVELEEAGETPLRGAAGAGEGVVAGLQGDQEVASPTLARLD